MWMLFQFFCHQKLSVAQESPKNRLDPNWMNRICSTTLKTKNKILLLCIGRLLYIFMQHIFYFIAIPYLFSLSIPPELCLILVGLVAFIFGCFELPSFIAPSVPIWQFCLVFRQYLAIWPGHNILHFHLWLFITGFPCQLFFSPSLFKVILSCQIRSAWEWYVLLQRPCFVHQQLTICLKFFILILHFKKRSKFLAASCKKPSNPLILRRTVCMETFLPICWRPFNLIAEKIRQSVA